MRPRVFACSAPLVSVALAVACSPAAPTPTSPLPTASASASVALSPAPKPAAWAFAGLVSSSIAEVDVEGGGRLRIGAVGTRWTMGADEKRTFAESLPPTGLADVRRDGSAYLFLAADGSLHTSTTPLGALTQKREPSAERALAFRFGQRALLGVTADGAVLRAPDPGAPWATSALGLARGERVVALETDRKGRAVVLVAPQRLLVSSDDGATFTAVGLAGIGAEQLVRDRAGEVWLRGAFGRFAKLAGDKLVVGGAPVAADDELAVASRGDETVTAHVVGDRRVVVRRALLGTETKATVEIGPLDGPLGAPRVVGSARDLEVAVTGRGSTVTLAVQRVEADAVVEVMQTTDDGKTLVPLGTFDGRLRSPHVLEAGPNDWLLLGQICLEDDCKARVRVNGEWRSIPVVPGAATVDEAAGLAFVWDANDGSLVQVDLQGGKPVALTGHLRQRPLAMGGDGAGGVRVAYSSSRQAVFSNTRADAVVVRYAKDEALDVTYLPFSPSTGSFAGKRGLFVTNLGVGYETADGGERWLPVALAGDGPPTCQAAGCGVGSAARIGWDLPASKRPLLTSSKQASTDPPPVAVAVAPPVKLDCKADEKKWKAIASDNLPVWGAVGLPGDVRWAEWLGGPGGQGGKVGHIELARGPGAPKVLKLLAEAQKPGVTARYHRASSDAGLGLIGYSYGPKRDGQYAPVDVELGWYDAASGKTAKAKIAGVKPFRIGSFEAAALVSIVEGGVVVLPDNPEAPLYLARVDGKVDALPRPPSPAPSVRYRSAVRVGKTLVLAAEDHSGYRASVLLASTSDDGKTWTSTTWTTGALHELGVAGGVPVLVASDLAGKASTVLRLDKLGPDLPTWTASSSSERLLAACPTKGGPGAPFSHRQRDAFTVSLESGQVLPGQRQVARVQLDGSLCTSALVAVALGPNPHSAIVSPADPTHGHLVRVVDDKAEWTTLSCKAP